MSTRIDEFSWRVSVKPAIALVALFIPVACAGNSDPTVPSGVTADSCAVEAGSLRPDFGGLATAADQELFAYDVHAPLNLQKAVELTGNGVEVSTTSFTSPDDGSVTGMLFDPVTRSSLRPGLVL